MNTNRIKFFKQIEKYFINLQWPVISLFIISLLSVSVSFVSPKMFQILVDDVMGKGENHKLYTVIIGLILVYILSLIVDSLSLYFSNKVINGFTYGIRLDIWKKFKNTRHDFLEKKESGDLKMRLMDDVNTAALFLKEQIIEYIYSFIIAVVALAILLLINIKMTLICICILPILFVINGLIAKGSQKLNEKSRILSQKYYTSTNNSISMWREIKVQSAEDTFIKRFRFFREEFKKLGYKSIKYWFFNESFGDFKQNYLSTVFIYCVGLYFILNNSLSIGYVIMFGQYYGMLFQSIDSINMKNAAFKANKPFYNRISETLEFPADERENVNKFRFEEKIDISISDFKYPNADQSVFHDFSLTINKGDFISVIGESGCGKTTLIKLMLGLYPVDSGSILYDGIDVKDISGEDLYKNIGVVMQDSYLFNLTIKDNLLIGVKNYKQADLIEACRMAGALDFINKLPDKFDTVIGEKGIKLSGGQKQKLCIARVLLKRPQLIIFDEATSSLDRLSEDEIYNSINNLADKVTVIVVSHKPSAILRAKNIVLIQKYNVKRFDNLSDMGNDSEYKLILRS